MEMLEKQLEAFTERDTREKLAAGWTRTEEGDWIPPGWVRVGSRGASLVEGGADECPENVEDSM
jgi:uncharacterized protein involved in type VI secretion and phage assembly